MPFYSIDGQRIFVHEDGPPNAQVALLIHGWSSSWYALSPLLPLLSRRFRCMAVDLPGYGNSPRLERRVTIAQYADLLARLVGEVSDSPAVLIGHSMGGMISLTMALRHPVLVERMVLLCPTISGLLSTFINLFISPITFTERFLPFSLDRIPFLEPYLLTVTDRLMRPASFAERTQITQDDYRRLREDARRPDQGRVRAECFIAMRNNDLRGRLRDVEAPSLVIWGAEDNTVPLRDAGVVADEWHSADLRIVPKAGHWPQFETPDITRRYLAAFLGLPVISSDLDKLSTPAVEVSRAAQFLAHSDIGNGLTLAQRTRLAAHCLIQSFPPDSRIVGAHDSGNDLYIVEQGSVDVWSDPTAMSRQLRSSRRLATLLPGQISGELALLDGGKRSAELRAGPEGASMLILQRDRLLALTDDDPVIGMRVLWNIAAALALRLRLTNWQVQIAAQESEGDRVAG